MTDYYLMSSDPLKVRELGRSLCVETFDKIDIYNIAKYMAEKYKGRGCCFYIIDDNAEIGELLADIMHKMADNAKHRVSYLDPKTAMERFKQERPDVVITDYHMERRGINGDGVIIKMRGMEKAAK
ncbi:MAG: hypothetical protein NT129_06630 [Candidatus Aenigmarchaeota archaeon]|nr:hypothetical protein [Candidatus Aenigmarchaeota archaeon]